MAQKIRFVVATRTSRDEFFAHTALGRSLAIYGVGSNPQIELRLFERNSLGLPVRYNQALVEAASDPAVLAFSHDDVHLCDFFWAAQVVHALARFEIVGLAGNKRRVPRQPAWPFVDENFTWDRPDNLSGVVGHGTGFPCTHLSAYGAPCQPVKLLDGLLLFARSQVLLDKDLRFDERFDFHFYDMDFCRQAEVKNVTMGTWSLSVVHESGGDFGSPGWRDSYGKYLDKWRS
jgi:hypothetical protein